MELCSLEDDDYGDMFITQESQNIIPLVPDVDVDTEMGDDHKVLEIEKSVCPQYSDISDADDFNLQPSQPVKKTYVSVITCLHC